jgi:chromosome partitioning protein
MMVQGKLNPDLAAPLFIFTQVDGRKRNHYQYRRYLRNRYQNRVLNSVIRTNAALATTYSDGTTVFEHDPYSRGARDYANATDELMQRILKAEQGDDAAEKEALPVSQPSQP